MSELKQVQEQLQNYLLHGQNSIIESINCGDANINKQRLDIYCHAYRLRIIEAMLEDFPGFKAFVGVDILRTMLSDYLESHPSTFFSLRDVGKHFATFLKQQSKYSEHKVYYDMARYEWAFVEAFDAADIPSCTVQELMQLPQETWGELKFQLHPSVQVLQFHNNIPSLVNQLRLTENKAEVPTIKFYEQTQTWLVWRKENEPYFANQDDSASLMLRGIAEGYDFAQCCESLCELHEEGEVAQVAVNILVNWLNDSMLLK